MSQDNSRSMAFYDHLDELRRRLMRSLWVFFFGFGLVFFTFVEPILDFLKKPLFAALPPDRRNLYFTSLFENFFTHLKIAGYGAIFLLAPYFFYEIWAFVAPGLREREKKFAVPFIAAATIFFLGGAAFAYWVLFPVGFKYFVQFGSPSDVAMLTIDAYYSTCIKLMVLFGLSFELPVIISLLGFLGLVDAATLRQHRKPAIIGITVMAALFAPPDAVSMILLGFPLVVMYEAAIWVVQWFGVRRKLQEAGQSDTDTSGLIPK